MSERRCLSCSRGFDPRPQAPDQQYCSDKACQQARRRAWQRERKRRDEDYRDNQRRAQRAWVAEHSTYWRGWREKHPEYCERNRERQEVRDRRRRSAGLLAKMDASGGGPGPNLGVPSGVYRLVPASGGLLAKMDVWTVRIAVISGPCETGPGSG
jgi:hypothetical protein